MVPGRDGGHPDPGGPDRSRVPDRARERGRAGAGSVCRARRAALRRLLRGGRGRDPGSVPTDRGGQQRFGLRGSWDPAGAEQHAVLVHQPAAVDPDRKLRQPRRDAPSHLVREPVSRSPCAPHPRDRRAGDCRSSPLQRDPGRDPQRPFRPLPGDDRGECEPGPFARRLASVCRRVRGARARRRDRRRDDRDRSSR